MLKYIKQFNLDAHIYMYSIFKNEKHKYKNPNDKKNLSRLPQLFFIFNDKDKELLLIDPTDSGFDNIELVYDYIFKTLINEINGNKFNPIEPKNWLSKHLMVYISHGHPDHYMGLGNKTFPFYGQNDIQVPVILHRKTCDYINDFNSNMKNEYGLLNKFYSETFVSIIKIFCNSSIGTYLPITNFMNKLGHLDLKLLDQDLEEDIFQWKCCKIHGGQGLRLEIKNLEENKYIVFLYDLFPPFIPFSTSMYPHTCVEDLIKLYQNLEKEVLKGKIDLVFWSHYKEGYGDGNCYFDDLSDFKEDMHKFVTIVTEIRKSYRELLKLKKIEIKKLLNFCKEITQKYLFQIFPKHLKSKERESFNRHIKFFFEYCRSNAISYDRDKFTVEGEIVEMDQLKLLPIILVNLIILNIIIEFDPKLIKKIS